MRLVFVGTSSFAVPILEGLLKTPEHRVLGVVTQPDSCGGRGRKELISPVKELVTKCSCPLHQPERINKPVFAETLKTLTPDAVVLAAYSQIIVAELLTIPRYGWINVHPSLLPKYRGAAPVPYALLKGEAVTGVTIIRMVEEMDAGPIIRQESLPIEPAESAPELEARLAQLGAWLLVESLGQLAAGKTEFKEQAEADASFAPCLKKEDGIIKWHNPAPVIYNHIRAMQSWPGAMTGYDSPKRGRIQIAITRARLGAAEPGTEAPGTIIEANKETLLVNTGAGTLQIDRLKPAGKAIMTAGDFINGYRLKPGERFA